MTRLLTPTMKAEMPSAAQVRDLYLAAASEPPLNEGASEADLFAGVYAASLRDDDVTAVTAHDGGSLTGFAYGHPWSWDEQRYEWALSLCSRLGEVTERLEGTQVLCLLARHPRATGSGLGRAVLVSWLSGIGPRECWLQTDDVDSPARRLYDALGFVPIGHGPDAPDGASGLVMLRDAPRGG